MTTANPGLGLERSSDARLWGAAAVASAAGVGFGAGKGVLVGAGVLLFIVVTYAVIVQPVVGVILLAAIMPVTSAMRRGLIVPHLRPSELLVIWLAPLVVLAARAPVRAWGTLEWLGLAYAAGTILLGGFDLWRRGAPFNPHNVDGLIGPLQYLLLLRAVRVGTTTARHRLLTMRILLLASVPVSLLALAQGFGAGWAHRFGVTLTGVDLGHLNRATGPFTNWQVLAGYLLAIGLLTVAVWAYRAEAILPSRIAVTIALLSSAALARTLTIGALIGLIIGSLVLVLSGREIRLSGTRLLTMAGIAILALVAVLVARYHQEFGVRSGQAGNGLIPNTVVDRVHNWTRQYLPALSGRWVTGFGPDLPPDASWKYTDSVYVTLILRGGLILVGIYAALMVGFASAARRLMLATNEMRAIGAALFVLVILLIPLQTIANYFTTSGLPEVLWITAALASISVLTNTATIRR